MTEPSSVRDDPFLDPQAYEAVRDAVTNATIVAGGASLTLDNKSLIIGLSQTIKDGISLF